MQNLGELMALLSNPPPVPVVANAVFRVFADAIVSEAKRRGPSTVYLAKMASAGYEEEISRAIYAYVFEEGIKSE